SLARWRSSHAVRLGGEYEITLGQPVDLVGPDGEPDPAPGEKDIRMMPLALGQFSDPVGKVQSAAEILEAIFLFQMMLCHCLPPPAELSQKRRQFRPLERRNF